MTKTTTTLLAAIAALGFGSEAMAQAAGAGADYNRAEAQRLEQERAKEAAFAAEVRRLEQIDRPLKDDVLGNAGTGGLANGAIRGTASGVANVVTRTITSGAAQLWGESSNASTSETTTADSE